MTNRWSKAFGNTRYVYDSVGNLTFVDYPPGTMEETPDVTFSYDALNRITNRVDAAGTTKYTYTAGGQLFTEDGPFSNDTVTNIYVNGLRTRLGLQQPTGIWTNAFAYDDAGRLTNVTSPAGIFGYAYTSSRQTLIERLTLPNTSYITNAYDSVARLTGTYLRTSSGALTNKHEYLYNAGNQRTQQVFAVGSSYGYKYDDIGQLKVADSATASEDRGYLYDTAWNLSKRTNYAAVTSFTVDSRNQLTGGPTSPYSYDDNGNLLGSDALYYEYDGENRLTWVSGQEHTVGVAYVYDGLGRLRKRITHEWDDFDARWLPFWETEYIYDNMRVVQERSGYSGYLMTVRYTRGNDLSGSLEGAGGIGGLLARSDNYSGHAYYHADGNGNVTFMGGTNQALLARYRYDPFGNMISSSGSLAAENTYRFSSKMFDTDLGLHYYGYRFYEPVLERWLNRDPLGEPGFGVLQAKPLLVLGDGPNRYLFVKNNPINSFDSFGLAGCSAPRVCCLVEYKVILPGVPWGFFNGSCVYAGFFQKYVPGGGTTGCCPPSKPPEVAPTLFYVRVPCIPSTSLPTTLSVHMYSSSDPEDGGYSKL